MALTYTPKAELGTSCPDFRLPSVVDGKHYSLSDFSHYKALVVMFICNHCPYVKAIEDRLISLAHEMTPLGCGFIGICSNDSQNYPDDAPEKLGARAKEKNYGFTYLHDADQSVAKKFDAVCTPDFFVYDGSRKLVYRGRLDDSWKEPSKVTRHELKEALMAVLQNQNPIQDQKPSMGCSIKWLHD